MSIFRRADSRGAALIACVGLAVSACGSDPSSPGANGEPDPDRVGSVSFAVTTVPTGVRCIQIVATGMSASVSQNLTVTAGTATTTTLGQLPLGPVMFQASAFNVACSGIATATASWVATPVSAMLQPGVISQISLNFHPNNPVNGRISFIGNILGLSKAGYGSYAVLSDGTALWWGLNPADSSSAQKVPAPLAMVSGATQIAGGLEHTCYRKADGTVWCWGRNTSGQFPGMAANAVVATPVQIGGLSNIAMLTAGYQHTCALDSSGFVQCWGANTNGQLGNGNFVSPGPVGPMQGNPTFARIYSGAYHSCGISNKGAVSCWGYNGAGSLGDGTQTNRPVATELTSIRGISALAIGFSHTCSLSADGLVNCWGDNTFGQLGDGTTSLRLLPTPIPSVNGATHLSAFNASTCAIVNGGLRCWGTALGSGSTSQQLLPRVVPGISNAAGFASGGSLSRHECLLLDTQEVYCWGQNHRGQVGDGTTEDRYVPVPALL